MSLEHGEWQSLTASSHGSLSTKERAFHGGDDRIKGSLFEH
jgi:hypothetical protein